MYVCFLSIFLSKVHFTHLYAKPVMQGFFNFLSSAKNYYQFFLHSMEKKSTKVDFSPTSCKNNHSTLKMDTFKVMLLLFFLALLDKKHRI